jgi:PKD repeat protein
MIIDQNGMVVTPPIFIYPTSSGQYSVYAEDACGTHDTGVVYIHVMELPVASIISDTTQGCQPLTVHFTESTPDQGQSFLWNFGDNENLSLAKNPIHIFSTPGTFNVTLNITSLFGCKTTVEFPSQIHVFPKPTAQFTWNPDFASIIEPVVSFSNLTANGSSYIWSFGDGDSSSLKNPVHRYLFPGTYPVQLIAISSLGCIDTANYPFAVQEEFTLFAPTAFSPDFDEINDYFYIMAHGIKSEDFYLAVYTRWSEIIWETTSFDQITEKSEKWDGRVHNKSVAPVGSYTWFIRFKDFKGNLHEKTGSVILIQ